MNRPLPFHENMPIPIRHAEARGGRGAEDFEGGPAGPLRSPRLCVGKNSASGFTLVEMLVVVAIIALLAAILIPSLGGAQKTARKRKAELECNAIKTAVEQFHGDFHYMPWKVKNDKERVGADSWAEDAADQKDVMDILRGENKLGKAYLEVSSRDTKGDEGVFYDPWGNPYRIGIDRNLDQQVDYKGKTYKARVLVISLGPDGEESDGNGKDDDIRTFDLEK